MKTENSSRRVSDQTTLDELERRLSQTSGDGAFDVRLEETMFWNGHDQSDRGVRTGWIDRVVVSSRVEADGAPDLDEAWVRAIWVERRVCLS